MDGSLRERDQDGRGHFGKRHVFLGNEIGDELLDTAVGRQIPRQRDFVTQCVSVLRGTARRDDGFGRSVITDLAEFRTLIGGTALAGRDPRAVSLPGGEVAFVVDTTPADDLKVWAAGRALLNATGRCPVMVAGFGGPADEEFFERYPGEFGDASVEQLLRAAYSRGGKLAIERLRTHRNSEDMFEIQAPSGRSPTGWALERTEQALGVAPPEADVREALGPNATYEEVERWILHWEEARGYPSVDPGHMTRFEDDGCAPIATVFFPTSSSWETFAHTAFFGQDGVEGTADLISVVGSWNERFGAELVSNYGTMLEFAVQRPPRTIEEAFDLACEHYWIAQCTTVLPGVSLRDHARCLVGRTSWNLHERP